MFPLAVSSSKFLLVEVVGHLEDGSTTRVSHNGELRLGHL